MTATVSEQLARAYLGWSECTKTVENAAKFLAFMRGNIKEQDIPTAEALLSKARVMAKTPKREDLPAVSATAKPQETAATGSPRLPGRPYRSKGVYHGR